MARRRCGTGARARALELRLRVRGFEAAAGLRPQPQTRLQPRTLAQVYTHTRTHRDAAAERNIAVGSAQYAWLAATLRAVDRDATPWLVVAGHRPGYVDSNAASDQARVCACVCVCVCARARACINVGSRGVM